jgi:hypothetical protein
LGDTTLRLAPARCWVYATLRLALAPFLLFRAVRLAARDTLLAGKVLLPRAEVPTSRYLPHLSNIVSDFRQKSSI